ncbi:MAG: hypothetical protein GF320_21615 [Armatimonadia bacterium]|nr:hypothetical protein [Armatimonadia bacterium]
MPQDGRRYPLRVQSGAEVKTILLSAGLLIGLYLASLPLRTSANLLLVQARPWLVAAGVVAILLWCGRVLLQIRWLRHWCGVVLRRDALLIRTVSCWQRERRIQRSEIDRLDAEALPPAIVLQSRERVPLPPRLTDPGGAVKHIRAWLEDPRSG